MKNIMPILLIIIMLLISFVTNKINTKDMLDYSLNLEEELEQDRFQRQASEENFYDGNTEYSGGSSSMYVEGLELLLEYLPPDAMVEYSEYMSVYSDGLINLLNKDEVFYNDNRVKIGDVFGIYDYLDYEKFADNFSNADINNDVKFVKIDNIKKEGGFLRLVAIVHFSSGESVNINQLLSYVYVKNTPMLFIYTEI